MIFAKRPGNWKTYEPMKKYFIIACLFLTSAFVFAQYASKYDDLYNINSEDWPYVNEDNVRVRTYPSIEHSKIITKFSTGKKVNVIEKTVNEKNELWYQVRINENSVGWMFGEYISFSDEYPSSKVYEREFSKYQNFIEAFYYELYDIYLYGHPYTHENSNCLKKLLAGKSPTKDSSYKFKANDSPGWGTAKTTIYEIKGCLIEVEGNYPNVYWHSSTFTKDVPNTFGVKMGMTLSELKQIFGEKTRNSNLPKGIGEAVIFLFDSNGKLCGITIYNEPGA